jgi:5-methylcytosine-specific restriction endonuclease McrA
MEDITGLLSTEDGTYAVTIRPMSRVEVEPVKRPRVAYPKTMRTRLIEAQSHRCAICGGPLSFYDSHIDHIIPRAANGTDDFSNLQLTHMSCNLRKGSGRGPHDPDQERMPWA